MRESKRKWALLGTFILFALFEILFARFGLRYADMRHIADRNAYTTAQDVPIRAYMVAHQNEMAPGMHIGKDELGAALPWTPVRRLEFGYPDRNMPFDYHHVEFIGVNTCWGWLFITHKID